MHGETCEMRRAREYGIDAPASTTATGWSPLSEYEKRRGAVDPEPRPRDYIDPIVYALAHSDWERRQDA